MSESFFASLITAKTGFMAIEFAKVLQFLIWVKVDTFMVVLLLKYNINCEVKTLLVTELLRDRWKCKRDIKIKQKKDRKKITLQDVTSDMKFDYL